VGVNDLKRVDLPKPDWADPHHALIQVYGYALDHAKDAERWYAEKRRPKKVGGQVLRIAAIVLLGVAALIPVLSEIVTDEGSPVIPPAWASAALIGAATLVALDRYFGFSAGWTRFMSADLKIARLRRDFEFSWRELEAPEGGVAGDPLGGLRLAREFVQTVDQVVAEETDTWSDEFHAALDSAVNELNQRQQDVH
jgi:hypothetical protein